jgi:simple sugar transport system ATP-binding protein
LTPTSALELQGITKRFGNTLANDSIDLKIEQGEIHAILGENGAGKTTLMNILYGLYTPDAGIIRVEGGQVEIKSPRDATSLGIQMVHQHFMLGIPFSVADNLVLGLEPTRAGVLMDRQAAVSIVCKLSERYGLKVDPHTIVRDLSVGEMQRVEILKALYREAKILILDEPTAVLTPLEIKDLFEVMQRLKANQKPVIFITHKLREVIAVADRVSVLRQGKLVGTYPIKEVNEARLIELMVGKTVQHEVTTRANVVGKPVLQVRGLGVVDKRRKVTLLRDISLVVNAGEILGIAGVEGNGQTELVDTLIGLVKAKCGSAQLDGIELLDLSPRKIMEAGLACIHEDRLRKGLVAEFTVSDNLILGMHYLKPIQQNLMIDQNRIAQISSDLVRDFDIRPPAPKMLTKYLSGGNQQKLILARELNTQGMKLLLASQPTRGLDVNATIFVHRTLRDLRDRGIGVLFISADLDEIRMLSDRIVVMYRGEIVATGAGDEFSDVRLGSLMLTGQEAMTFESATHAA